MKVYGLVAADGGRGFRFTAFRGRPTWVARCAPPPRWWDLGTGAVGTFARGGARARGARRACPWWRERPPCVRAWLLALRTHAVP